MAYLGAFLAVIGVVAISGYFLTRNDKHTRLYTVTTPAMFSDHMPYDLVADMTLEHVFYTSRAEAAFWQRLMLDRFPTHQFATVCITVPRYLYNELSCGSQPNIKAEPAGGFKCDCESRRLLAGAATLEILDVSHGNLAERRKILKCMLAKRTADRADQETRRLAREVTFEEVSRIEAKRARGETVTAEDEAAATRYMTMGEHLY